MYSKYFVNISLSLSFSVHVEALGLNNARENIYYQISLGHKLGEWNY